MIHDHDTTLKELRDRIRAFRDEREWGQFHDPKNLIEAMNIEVAELMELTLWKDSGEVEALFEVDPVFREKFVREFADILTYAIGLSNRLDIDMTAAIIEKLEITGQKYPVDKVKGTRKKYTEL